MGTKLAEIESVIVKEYCGPPGQEDRRRIEITEVGEDSIAMSREGFVRLIRMLRDRLDVPEGKPTIIVGSGGMADLRLDVGRYRYVHLLVGDGQVTLELEGEEDGNS